MNILNNWLCLGNGKTHLSFKDIILARLGGGYKDFDHKEYHIKCICIFNKYKMFY